MIPAMPRSSPAIAAVGILMTVAVAAAQPPGIAEWRSRNERAIVEELTTLVAIPNVAGNDADMRQNADHLAGLFRRRGFSVETVGGPGSPVVFASLDVAKPAGTLTFYIHYDGQPVTASQWTRCQPFAPCLWSAGGAVPADPARTRFEPEWRLYGRSASDDKGPIVALLNAVDALKATGGGPSWNVRVVLDGEEEAGSANFRRFAEARPQALETDLAVTLDGPRHPIGRPTVYFGVRGGVGVTITVYGAAGDLHSGNYGNWAPDPSMALAKLLASMKDDQGRVTIQDFYRDVRPLTAAERQALDEAPNVEAVLARDFSVARPERPDTRLEVKLNEPTLGILVMESGGGLSVPGRSAIPATATARLEVRMVKDLIPETQNALITEYVRRQGYFVVTGRDPSPEERRVQAKIARVDPRGRGSAASRVSMDDPRSQAVIRALTRSGVPPVRLPTLGGGLPFGTFSDQYQMPTVGVSIVNFDNNQHGPDENLRLQNLWEGIEMLASLMTMPGSR
jgi:acetylornithine deacetylase/succinyl-diaminopimelate desuccinylase-like protein